MKCLIALAFFTAAVAVGATGPANAQTAEAGRTAGRALATGSAGVDMVDGEVRKIDKDAGKITLRHAEIRNLDMEGMTMVFQVKDPAMLESVKVGDKIRFQAQKIEGALVVTELQPVK
jgi:Cu/Ag efflux protein CusF